MSAMGVGYLNEALIAGFAARMGNPELAAYRIVDNLLLTVCTVLPPSPSWPNTKQAPATAIRPTTGAALARACC
ncbi:hypothetical protein ACFWY5_28050 [Nonomuraea sp. NPDC059007]|uniref:hypothetical protein n=1 Tax=Nonomuraea sp. NPDC059007 TaxID=3346692 RepID=UPI003692CFD5